jgi:hypothetical protein
VFAWLCNARCNILTIFLVLMLGKDFVRVLGPIGLGVHVGQVDIDDDIGASRPKVSDEEISMLVISQVLHMLNW